MAEEAYVSWVRGQIPRGTMRFAPFVPDSLLTGGVLLGLVDDKGEQYGIHEVWLHRGNGERKGMGFMISVGADLPGPLTWSLIDRRLGWDMVVYVPMLVDGKLHVEMCDVRRTHVQQHYTMDVASIPVGEFWVGTQMERPLIRPAEVSEPWIASVILKELQGPEYRVRLCREGAGFMLDTCQRAKPAPAFTGSALFQVATR